MPANWRWVILNAVEFFLSFGPVLGWLSVVGIAVALFSLPRATFADKFSVAVAVTFLATGIFGHTAEVYRL